MKRNGGIRVDISVIKAHKTNKHEGIIVGEAAPKKVVEFLNLRCPFCKQWFDKSLPILEAAVAEQKVQRIIKLIDRPKESLQRGNVMHRFVTTDDGAQAMEDLKKIFASQDQWAHMTLKEVSIFAKNELGLKEHGHLAHADELIQETVRANIKFVPTVIIDEHIFDENIDEATLKSYLEE